MNILYLHQYFTTRNRQGGTRSYELARNLVKLGHKVTMITSGLMNDEFPVSKNKVFEQYETEGIRVIPIAAGYADTRKGTGIAGWQRMIKFLDFSRLASKVGKKFEKPDIVFATHTPLPIGIAGIKLGRHFQVPFIFEVRDLWPDALINVGALKNPVVIFWLRRMEKKIYHAANHIVALSPGMKKGICKGGIAEEKVTVIPNASDLDLFQPGLDGSIAEKKLKVGGRFSAIYFGAMGIANGLDYTVKAAQILKKRGRDDIAIILHGDGGERQNLERMVKKWSLDNVIFSSPVPEKEEMARIVAGCNACMTIYKATKEESWSPNKLFDALAAGKPVLINVNGWLREIVEENGCGRYVDPANPEDLANSLEILANDKEKCKGMGQNARTLAENEFARKKLVKKLENVFVNALRSHP